MQDLDDKYQLFGRDRITLKLNLGSQTDPELSSVSNIVPEGHKICLQRHVLSRRQETISQHPSQYFSISTLTRGWVFHIRYRRSRGRSWTY